MDFPRLFKRLVVANILLNIAWLVLPYIQARFLSLDTFDALSWAGSGAILLLPQKIHWLADALYFFAAIGIYHLIHSARTLFVIIVAFQQGWVLFEGMYVMTPAEIFLGNILTLQHGFFQFQFLGHLVAKIEFPDILFINFVFHTRI